MTENTSVMFYGTKEIAKMLDCSIPTAREIMHRADFPLITAGRKMKVSKIAFEQWAMTRRV